MKLGMVITRTDPEMDFNAPRLAACSLGQGDQARIFRSGARVGIDQIDDPTCDVKGQARMVLDACGEFLACGRCLKLRDGGGSEIRPLSTLRDRYGLVRDSDRLVTV